MSEKKTGKFSLNIYNYWKPMGTDQVATGTHSALIYTIIEFFLIVHYGASV